MQGTAAVEAQTQAPGSTEAPDPTEVRYLTPEVCKIYVGPHGALHVKVYGEEAYGGVYAVYAFPVWRPDGYVSLMHSGSQDGDDQEIGIIRELADFPRGQADLVCQALDRRYFVHTIRRIAHIGWKYGFVSMEVETDKGTIQFLMRHQRKRAVDCGRHGKILIDVSENRYLIPDLTALSAKEHRDFTRIIYW